MRFTLVTTAKNEGPYFLEWVAHHRRIGFTDILVYQNDSQDHSDAILKMLRDQGAIRYFANPARPGTHQLRAYRRAARQAEVQTADWVLALDMDEFLHIHAGDGTLPALIAALPPADAVLLNWRRFGHGGETLIQDAPVTERFVTAEAAQRVATHLTPYKTLFRPAAFGQFGIHQPRAPKRDAAAIAWVNGSGLRPEAFRWHEFRATDPGRWGLAQINHYITRDAASFVLKSDKGSAHQAHRGIDESYWTRRNFNDETDRGLADLGPETRAAMERLDAESGGRLSRQRQRALAWHRERFATLLEDPRYRALFDFCAA